MLDPRMPTIIAAEMAKLHAELRRLRRVVRAAVKWRLACVDKMLAQILRKPKAVKKAAEIKAMRARVELSIAVGKHIEAGLAVAAYRKGKKKND